MSNKKQTSVDWFFSELQRMQYFIGNDMLQAYKDAKEMEKEQMEDAWDNGFANGFDLGKYDDITNPDDAEQYYKENYEA